MAIDLFETRTMLRTMEQLFTPRTFFLDKFFQEENVADTEHVDIDVVKGKRRLAAFVNPLKQGKQVEKLPFTTNSYVPPYVKPKRVTTAEDLLKRDPGQHLYLARDPQDRAMERLAKDLVELSEDIVRREEWMAAQVLTTGKIPILGDGVNVTIDFFMEASHLPVLAGADLWDAGTSDPLQDLRDWRRIIVKDSGVNPDTVVMGHLAFDEFIKHTKVKDALDTRRIDLGLIRPETLPNGTQFIGDLGEIGAAIFVYDEWYLDTSAVLQTLMPEKKVLFGSTRARSVRQYGAIKDVRATVPVRMFPKSWIVEDPSARLLMVQSAPLPSLHQPDAFLTATVLA